MRRLTALAIAAFALQGQAAVADSERADAMVDVDSVELPAVANRVIDFVPAGWKLQDKVEGDLNGDGRDDAAIVIQGNDPRLIITDGPGLGNFPLDRNPRILLVLFQEEDGLFEPAGENRHIIPNHEYATMSDPFEAIDIRDGKLFLDLLSFANAGSWMMSTSQFTFRWNGDFVQLIGYDCHEQHRASGAFKDVSVNFLTRSREDREGNIATDDDKAHQSKISRTEPIALGDVGNGFEFQP